MKDSTPDHVPELSIIVPVKNGVGRLENCLDSLLEQQFTDFELILVENGSSDGSLDVCRRYEAADRRVKVIHSDGSGVGLARNLGLDAAAGKWAAFCDADDRTAPGLYWTLLENARRREADLSCCALVDIGPEESKSVTNFPFTGEVLLTEKEEIMRRIFLPLLTGDRSVHGYLVTCVFRRELIERAHIRFAPGISMREDELFLLEYLLETRRVVGTDRVLYCYLRSENSACSAYYRKEGDYLREMNLYLRACGHYRIFRKGFLENSHPELLPGLVLRMYFHRAQMICCKPGSRYSAKLRKLRVVAEEAKKERLPASGSWRILRWMLVHCRFLLPPLLFCKRRKDELVRRIEHIRDGK